MGVNFLLIQRVPSERRTYALQHHEHRVENQASLGWLPNSETIAHPVPPLGRASGICWDSRRRKRCDLLH